MDDPIWMLLLAVPLAGALTYVVVRVAERVGAWLRSGTGR